MSEKPDNDNTTDPDLLVGPNCIVAIQQSPSHSEQKRQERIFAEMDWSIEALPYVEVIDGDKQ